MSMIMNTVTHSHTISILHSLGHLLSFLSHLLWNTWFISCLALAPSLLWFLAPSLLCHDRLSYHPLCPSSVWLLVCHQSVRCPMVNCLVRCSIWCCSLVYSEYQPVLGLCFLWSFWLLLDGYSYIHPHLQTKKIIKKTLFTVHFI